MLAAAELLASVAAEHAADDDDAGFVGSLLDGATRAGGASLWPLELQVRWLRLAAAAAVAPGQMPGSAAEAEEGPANLLLQAVAAREPNRLLPHAASLFEKLPLLAQADSSSAARAAAAELACVLAAEAARQHFRLSLRDAHLVLSGCLRLLSALGAGEAAALRPLTARLATTAIDNLPAKCRSECVFHRRRMEGLQAEDVVSWCELLADAELLGAAGSGEKVPDSLWWHLATEAVKVVRRGEPDGAALALLRALATEGTSRDWDAAAGAEASPLGAVVCAVAEQWRFAVAVDAEEAEDEEHEPLPIPADVESGLRAVFGQLGIEAPHHPPPLPRGRPVHSVRFGPRRASPQLSPPPQRGRRLRSGAAGSPPATP